MDILNRFKSFLIITIIIITSNFLIFCKTKVTSLSVTQYNKRLTNSINKNVIYVLPNHSSTQMGELLIKVNFKKLTRLGLTKKIGFNKILRKVRRVLKKSYVLPNFSKGEILILEYDNSIPLHHLHRVYIQLNSNKISIFNKHIFIFSTVHI